MTVGHQNIRAAHAFFHHPVTKVPDAGAAIKNDLLATTRNLDTRRIAAEHDVFRGRARNGSPNPPEFNLEPHRIPLIGAVSRLVGSIDLPV